MILLINQLLTFFEDLLYLLRQPVLEMLLELDLPLVAKQLLHLAIEPKLLLTTFVGELELLLFLLLLTLGVDPLFFLQTLDQLLHRLRHLGG